MSRFEGPLTTWVAQCHPLTEALGSVMVFIKARDALVQDRIVSVLLSLNHRVAALSYIAVGWL